MAWSRYTLRRSTLQRPADVISPRPVVFHRRRSLHVEQPTPDGDRDRVRAVIGTELVDQIFDVVVDGCFGDSKAIGDLLIAIAVANEPQYIELPGA